MHRWKRRASTNSPPATSDNTNRRLRTSRRIEARRRHSNRYTDHEEASRTTPPRRARREARPCKLAHAKPHREVQGKVRLRCERESAPSPMENLRSDAARTPPLYGSRGGIRPLLRSCGGFPSRHCRDRFGPYDSTMSSSNSSQSAPLWYCVVDRECRLLYLGTDEAEALKHAGTTGVLAQAPRLGDAMAQAAFAAGEAARRS